MNSNNKSSSIGFCGILAIAFIILKLVGVINWSWVWVLSPLWIDILLLIIIFGVLYLYNSCSLNSVKSHKKKDKLKW